MGFTDFDGLTVAATHGSPWQYDRYVPVVFAGSGRKQRQVSRGITPHDIAPTLSHWLNIQAPSEFVGTVLTEVSRSGFSKPP